MTNTIKFRVEDLDDDVALDIFQQLDKIYNLLWKTLADTYEMEHPEATDEEVTNHVNQRIALEQVKK